MLALALTALSLSAYSAYDSSKLGGSTFPKRRKTPTIRQSRAAAKDKEEKDAAKNNPKKVLSIPAFCGHKFGEKGSGQETVEEVLDKGFFGGGYRRLRLEYAPKAGLYSITAINDDAFPLGSSNDIKEEMRKVMAIVEKRLKIIFTSEIKSHNNAKFGQAYERQATASSITGGINGYKMGTRTVVTQAATQIACSVTEEFANFTITLYGVMDKVNNVRRMEFTIKRK